MTAASEDGQQDPNFDHYEVDGARYMTGEVLERLLAEIARKVCSDGTIRRGLLRWAGVNPIAERREELTSGRNRLRRISRLAGLVSTHVGDLKNELDRLDTTHSPDDPLVRLELRLAVRLFLEKAKNAHGNPTAGDENAANAEKQDDLEAMNAFIEAGNELERLKAEIEGLALAADRLTGELGIRPGHPTDRWKIQALADLAEIWCWSTGGEVFGKAFERFANTALGCMTGEKSVPGLSTMIKRVQRERRGQSVRELRYLTGL